MTTLGSESSPIDRLDVDTALDHWANGKGGDVYVDATSHMISGGGSVFDLQSFSNGLLSTAKFSSNGASYHLESNVAKAGESGDPRISATYNYYDYEGWIATDPHEIPNSVVWGKTSATVNATVKVIEKPVT